MLKQLLKYLFFFMSIGLLSNCTNKSEPRHVNKIIPHDFKREVPIYKEGELKDQEELFYKHMNKEAYLLRLDSLETGYDSLQIRIWLGHSMASIRYIVILKYKNKIWKGQLVAFGQENENIISSKKIKNVSPISGWSKLIDCLYKLGIVTLPHQTDILGYNGGGADGISYEFEVATLKKYRAYRYSNPEERLNFWQANNVLKIAALVEKEFDFQYLK